ncbi:prepilin-type N-terminal cleavage/methylation domain-containing protein [Alteromonas sp. ASW11-19]|uniref:Prepilin-type N-terminal cleavage/methylation domain-containing protein n=1 Tax=Alteromonas salexigens TaxID=2982530 RepID=A0ABT2VU12_9ALTE|nr:prepilin-type N-terminal cleavage/methylation domain-containing protein [Alteromonas salexigens]MCU7555731.1 prepilin-type N-terminal cleavage/methylation domain-containing protein [Alteromonas salexigens]
MQYKERYRGMTLVELLVVIVIVGVLATLTVSAAGAQMKRQQLLAMQTALLHARAEQANFWLVQGRYSGTVLLTEDPRFSLRVDQADTTTYTLVAQSQTTLDNGCEKLVVTATTLSPAHCWP